MPVRDALTKKAFGKHVYSKLEFGIRLSNVYEILNNILQGFLFSSCSVFSNKTF